MGILTVMLLILLCIIIVIFLIRPQKKEASSSAVSSSRDEGKSKFSQFVYELVSLEGDAGRGFFVRRIEDQQNLRWETLPRSEGLESIDVVGESYRMEALQQSCFAAGSQVLLLPEPNNPYDPNAVAVWDIKRQLQAGYIPREYSARIAHKIAKGEIKQCTIMWEGIRKKKRNSIRLLLIGHEASIRMP